MSELRTNRIVPRDGLPSGSSGGTAYSGWSSSAANTMNMNYMSATEFSA